MGVAPRTDSTDVLTALYAYKGDDKSLKAMMSLVTDLDNSRSRGTEHGIFSGMLAAATTIGNHELLRLLNSAERMGEFLRAIGDVKNEVLAIIVSLAREALFLHAAT
jgi:hypothetical protein